MNKQLWAAALYPHQDAIALGDYYTRHVSEMTAEGLDSKSDIAAQLAWRDKEIDALRAALAAPAEPDPTLGAIKDLLDRVESIKGGAANWGGWSGATGQCDAITHGLNRINAAWRRLIEDRDAAISQCARTALAATAMPTEPKGWRWVPVEPTTKMAVALYEAMRHLCSPKQAVQAWADVLAAAPQPASERQPWNWDRNFYLAPRVDISEPQSFTPRPRVRVTPPERWLIKRGTAVDLAPEPDAGPQKQAFHNCHVSAGPMAYRSHGPAKPEDVGTIEKHGTVTVSQDGLQIADFSFNNHSLSTGAKAAIRWAIARLERQITVIEAAKKAPPRYWVAMATPTLPTDSEGGTPD